MTERKTEMKDHDISRRRPQRTRLSGMHNALVANPELREAHREAVDEGHEDLDAFEVAYREVFGDEYWENEYGEWAKQYRAEQ